MKLLKSTLSALLLFCFMCSTSSFSPSSPFSHEKYSNADGDTLLYRQLVSDYEPVSI